MVVTSHTLHLYKFCCRNSLVESASRSSCNMYPSIAFIFLVCALYGRSALAALPTDFTNGCTTSKAICRLYNGTVTGVIRMRQNNPNAAVQIQGRINGLSSGLHGFHVHQYGDLSNGCASAGGHFNPFGMEHGGPADSNRHVGDLGNIMADNSGEAEINISDNQLKLCGPLSIMGRAIVVHAGEDDLGRGGNAESKRTGNAGARLGCCVIGHANAS